MNVPKREIFKKEKIGKIFQLIYEKILKKISPHA